MKEKHKKQKTEDKQKNGQEINPAQDVVELPKQELDELRQASEELKQLQDKCMRMAAEVENFKKRVQKEKDQFMQFAKQDILLQLLPIIDDFDRAQEAAKAHEHGEAFSKGVEMILNQLHKLLNDNGVEKIKSINEDFDPHLHEAIGILETDKAEEDKIAEEVSPGYIINGKLLRAAKVKISKKTQGEGDQKNDTEN